MHPQAEDVTGKKRAEPSEYVESSMKSKSVNVRIAKDSPAPGAVQNVVVGRQPQCGRRGETLHVGSSGILIPRSAQAFLRRGKFYERGDEAFSEIFVGVVCLDA